MWCLFNYVRHEEWFVPLMSFSCLLQLLVEVVDVNENIHAPHFDDFVILATVRENRPPGTHVTTVRATDEDLPTTDDGRLSYSIRGGDGIGLFNIDNQGNHHYD